MAMKRSDLMTSGGESRRRNLDAQTRAIIVLGALAYAERADTVELARLMSVSTRTIKRACALLESSRLVTAERRGSLPTVWKFNTMHVSAHEIIECKAHLLAWLAAGSLGSLKDYDVWKHFVDRCWHYAKRASSSPLPPAAAIAHEVEMFTNDNSDNRTFLELRNG